MVLYQYMYVCQGTENLPHTKQRADSISADLLVWELEGQVVVPVVVFY